MNPEMIVVGLRLLAHPLAGIRDLDDDARDIIIEAARYIERTVEQRDHG